MDQLVNFNDIPKHITNVKIDIGLSYNAPQSQIWLAKESNTIVFGFEPCPNSVANILNRNFVGHYQLDKKYINEGRFRIIHCALSINEGNLDFYVNKCDWGTSSLYKPKSNIFGELDKIIKVPVYTLKRFFDIFPWEKFDYIDYVKIDTQGSDLDIIKSAGNYLSEKVVYVTAEPDGYQYYGAESCNHVNICEYMTGIGFITVKHPNTNDPTFLNSKFHHLKDIYI